MCSRGARGRPVRRRVVAAAHHDAADVAHFARLGGLRRRRHLPIYLVGGWGDEPRRVWRPRRRVRGLHGSRLRATLRRLPLRPPRPRKLVRARHRRGRRGRRRAKPAARRGKRGRGRRRRRRRRRRPRRRGCQVAAALAFEDLQSGAQVAAALAALAAPLLPAARGRDARFGRGAGAPRHRGNGRGVGVVAHGPRTALHGAVPGAGDGLALSGVRGLRRGEVARLGGPRRVVNLGRLAGQRGAVDGAGRLFSPWPLARARRRDAPGLGRPDPRRPRQRVHVAVRPGGRRRCQRRRVPSPQRGHRHGPPFLHLDARHRRRNCPRRLRVHRPRRPRRRRPRSRPHLGSRRRALRRRRELRHDGAGRAAAGQDRAHGRRRHGLVCRRLHGVRNLHRRRARRPASMTCFKSPRRRVKSGSVTAVNGSRRGSRRSSRSACRTAASRRRRRPLGRASATWPRTLPKCWRICAAGWAAGRPRRCPC
mmetsp:Transcript_25476/g.85575  ORF Transcript_25476/g.85575 Transcript_25476/m.85575 type:complete len:479 (+) Transcript_25476:365-1801(+)